MYNPKDIIDIIAGNIRKTRNPFGIPKFLVNRWHKGLDMSGEGDKARKRKYKNHS